MDNFLTKRLIAVWLFSTTIFALQSCDDDGPHLDKSKVQFSLSPGAAAQGRVNHTDLPENARLSVSIQSRSGMPVMSNHEILVLKTEAGYVADPLDLLPGDYVITDFMVLNDSEVLNAAPKSKSPFSEFVMHSLPHNFSVTGNSVAKVSMQVIDVRNEKPESFGYASFKVNKPNTLSFIVSKSNGASTSLRSATAELRQGKHVVKSFPVRHGVNKVTFEGDPDALYTLSVYTGEAANARTFNFKQLKEELGARPLRIELAPALLLSMESFVDEANEYEQFFEFVLDGTGGTVNIDWGDGHQQTSTLPFYGEHEYTTGNYTAIVTGDLDKIANLYGFSYETYIKAITGLTNLTGLKIYNPSWGAVPINVDLSNCKNLETIFIEKYGAPYEAIDLRTDFKLPDEHFISEFVFHVPSIDETRENITTEELDVMVNNIYANTTARNIRDGKFFVYPIDAPSPEAQQKLDILQNDYNWDVRFDGNIWDDYSEFGRSRHDLDARRDNWLRLKFPNSKRISPAAKMVFID